ncbi:MAG: hypothetical protein FD189_1734 [Elusimicrobia bacterium]|nr:MAG: hypothetical protein FD154_1900 [Elusimicrobiota bacterium]KAF0154693.1 MAG: hypothetical protein FD189_1734 [Elusimicrobiota bacterium]
MNPMIKIAGFVLSVCFLFQSPAAAAPCGLDFFDNPRGCELRLPGTCEAPALPDAMASEGAAPVVITVAGLKFDKIGPGKLNLGLLLRVIRRFFPGKSVDEAVLAGEVESFNTDHFMLDEGEEPASEGAVAKLPDDYMEVRVREFPDCAAAGVTVIPFHWSRDPDDTDKIVPAFMEKLAGVHAEYGGRRPIYVLAHSWGSMLMHETLHRLSRTRPDIMIDRFITTGSPLVPSNPVIGIFVKIGIKKEDLEKHASRPVNVGQWRNIWSGRDPYSNEIKPADLNVRVDSGVENVEPTLIDLILNNKPLRKEAKSDLWRIRDIKKWHFSYLGDFSTVLRSIEKEITVEVFAPHVARPLVDPSAKK